MDTAAKAAASEFNRELLREILRIMLHMEQKLNSVESALQGLLRLAQHEEKRCR